MKIDKPVRVMRGPSKLLTRLVGMLGVLALASPTLAKDLTYAQALLRHRFKRKESKTPQIRPPRHASTRPGGHLPRIEKSRAGYDVHIPLVECVQGPTRYSDISPGVRRIAGQILEACPQPKTYRCLTDAEVTRLQLPPAGSAQDRATRIRCKVRIARLLAAVARNTNGIEWGADLIRDGSNKLSYAITRGALNTAFLIDDNRSSTTTVGVISHNHPDGTAQPSFGDLQAMSMVRQAAKRFGVVPHNDEVIVVNLPGRDQFKLVRYEHAFRD